MGVNSRCPIKSSLWASHQRNVFDMGVNSSPREAWWIPCWSFRSRDATCFKTLNSSISLRMVHLTNVIRPACHRRLQAVDRCKTERTGPPARRQGWRFSCRSGRAQGVLAFRPGLSEIRTTPFRFCLGRQRRNGCSGRRTPGGQGSRWHRRPFSTGLAIHALARAWSRLLRRYRFDDCHDGASVASPTGYGIDALLGKLNRRRLCGLDVKDR